MAKRCRDTVLNHILNVSILRMHCKTVLRHRFESIPQYLPTEDALQNDAATPFCKTMPRHRFESVPQCLPTEDAMQNDAATPC